MPTISWLMQYLTFFLTVRLDSINKEKACLNFSLASRSAAAVLSLSSLIGTTPLRNLHRRGNKFVSKYDYSYLAIIQPTRKSYKFLVHKRKRP